MRKFDDTTNEESWNPWHGCHKISSGCMYCYVYRGDEKHGLLDNASKCHKTKMYDYPIRKKKNGLYYLAPNSFVYTCFTSDFLLEDADEFRTQAWQMIKERSDCMFCFFTKRIDRLALCLPTDWCDGYDNVVIGCTVENQQMADYRLPIFNSLPIKHKLIIVAPQLEEVNVEKYLNNTITYVSCSGESGDMARLFDYNWALDLREQCIRKHVNFIFHQTGANFKKDNQIYKIPRYQQIAQATKANIDYYPK